MSTSSRMLRSLRVIPKLNDLESRLVPSITPSDLAQEFLERLNDARANPTAYGQSIGVDLSYIAASQPFAFNTDLIQSALLHSQDMSNNNYFAHNSLNGETPFQRMTDAGYNWTSAAESIAAGYSSVEAALSGLIIDSGVPNLGHRNQLLSNGSGYQQQEVGIGLVLNGTGSYGSYYTIDGGSTSDSNPFITGVVYNDANGNHLYDAGEGLSGATVSVAGGPSTTTWSTGGFSLRVSPGSYTVTISGGGLTQAITEHVTVGSTNARLSVDTSSVGVSPPPPASPPPPSTITVPPGGGNPSLGSNGTTPAFLVGPDAGSAPTVTVYNSNGSANAAMTVFSAGMTNGVRTALADFNGDGVPDIVVGSGPGTASLVKIIDGASGATLFSVQPFEASFTGGVFVSVGDLGAGHPDLIITPDQGGGPRVRVFDGKSFTIAADFFGINDPNFRGGARAAIGDVAGRGYGDLIVSAGFGGGPRIAGFDGKSVLAGNPTHLFTDFFAFEPTLTNGAYVTVGDINGDGRADIICGAGPGGGPRVSVFDGADLMNGNQSRIIDFFAGDVNNRGGVRVAAKNLDNDAYTDLVVGAGTGAGSRVTVYAGKDLTTSPSSPTSSYSFDAIPGFNGGVFVG